jgi:hypothetical protein
MHHPSSGREVERRQQLPGRKQKFNLISHLSALPTGHRACESAAKALTAPKAPSIRAQMAAGAIPPPLFFGQRPPPLKWQMGFSATAFPEISVLGKTSSVDHAVQAAGALMRSRANSRLKDI